MNHSNLSGDSSLGYHEKLQTLASQCETSVKEFKSNFMNIITPRFTRTERKLEAMNIAPRQ